MPPRQRFTRGGEAPSPTHRNGSDLYLNPLDPGFGREPEGPYLRFPGLLRDP